MSTARTRLRSYSARAFAFAMAVLASGISAAAWAQAETDEEIKATVLIGTGLQGLFDAVHLAVMDFAASGSPMHDIVLRYLVVPLIAFRTLFLLFKYATTGDAAEGASTFVMMMLWFAGFQYYAEGVTLMLDLGLDLSNEIQRQALGTSDLNAPFRYLWQVAQSYAVLETLTPQRGLGAMLNPLDAMWPAIVAGTVTLGIGLFTIVVMLVLYMPIIGGGVLGYLGLFIFPLIFLEWTQGIVSAWVKALFGAIIFMLCGRITVVLTVAVFSHILGVEVPADGQSPAIAVRGVDEGNLANVMAIFVLGTVTMLGSVPLANRIGGGAEVGLNGLMGLAMSGRTAGQMGSKLLGKGAGAGAAKGAMAAAGAAARGGAGGALAGPPGMAAGMAANAAKAGVSRAVQSNNG